MYIFNAMSKKIIITERQERLFLKSMLKEQTFPTDPTKVLLVKDLLDSNFAKGTLSKGLDKNGLPLLVPVVYYKVNGTPDEKSPLDARGVFDRLELKFQHMFADPKQRTQFLKAVIKDWYKGGISREGLLSKTNY